VVGQTDSLAEMVGRDTGKFKTRRMCPCRTKEVLQLAQSIAKLEGPRGAGGGLFHKRAAKNR